MENSQGGGVVAVAEDGGPRSDPIVPMSLDSGRLPTPPTGLEATSLLIDRTIATLALAPSDPPVEQESSKGDARGDATPRARQSTPRPTHFICVPLVNSTSRPQLARSLAQLKITIRQRYPKIPPGAVRPVGSIHLTLGVMTLPTPADVERAKATLHTLSLAQFPPPKNGSPERVDTTAGITVSLRSLRAMDKARYTSVLYIDPVDPSNGLSQTCRAILNHFITANILERSRRPLKLHATVLNTRYVAKGDRRWMVDARGLVDDFADHVWAEKVHLDRVAICAMGARKVWEQGTVVDEVYDEVDSVPLW